MWPADVHRWWAGPEHHFPLHRHLTPAVPSLFPGRIPVRSRPDESRVRFHARTARPSRLSASSRFLNDVRNFFGYPLSLFSSLLNARGTSISRKVYSTFSCNRIKICIPINTARLSIRLEFCFSFINDEVLVYGIFPGIPLKAVWWTKRGERPVPRPSPPPPSSVAGRGCSTTLDTMQLNTKANYDNFKLHLILYFFFLINCTGAWSPTRQMQRETTGPHNYLFFFSFFDLFLFFFYFTFSG